LSASKALRRLTTTLAWFTPTNHQHRNYRKAHLFLTVPESDIGTKTIGLDAKSAQRGTVEHRIFEGDDAKAFLEGATLSIQVNCKQDGGQLNENIAYAVAVTLEVGENVNIDVYQEISVRLRQVVQIPPVQHSRESGTATRSYGFLASVLPYTSASWSGSPSRQIYSSRKFPPRKKRTSPAAEK